MRLSLLHGNRWLLGAAFATASAAATTAQARPSFTIKECAEASTLRATIDPKKPDAKKSREVERLMEICRRKAAAENSGPAPSAPALKPLVRRDPPPPPPPARTEAPPRPTPRPFMPGATAPAPAPAPAQAPAGTQQRTLGLSDLANLFSGKRRAAAPPAAPPPAPPRAAMAPRAAAAPAAPPAPAPAASPGPAPAAAPAAPVTVPAALQQPPVSTLDQRNVFGITFGRALELPACAPNVINAKDPRAFESTSKVKHKPVTETCIQTGPSVQALAQRMADAEGKPIPQGIEFALVRLAADRCPNWVSGSCTLSVALHGPIPLGVALLTAENGESAVGHALSEKYGSSPGELEPAACDAPGPAGAQAPRRMGSDTTWKFRDLSVSYWSVGGLNCGQGRILVQSTAMTNLFARAMAGDDQPKM